MALRPVATQIVLVFASLVVACGVLELSLRILNPPPVRFFSPQEFYDPDPEMGHTLRPWQTAFTHDRSVQTSSLGLRDREITPHPASGTLRVIALGDSQTFGIGLSLSETWPKQLERMLHEVSPSRWEVINSGIPGTDTWQHEILLGRLVKATDPHVVVLAMYVNDVVPRHNPRSVDASSLSNTWSERLAYLLKRSSVITAIYYRLLLPWQARRVDNGSRTEEAVLTGSNDERADRGWRQVEHSLAVMKGLCDSRGIALLVAILPRRDQVSGRHPGRVYNERARTVAGALGITAIDLLPSLAEEYRIKGDALFIAWDGHNSAAANHVIAGRIRPILEDLGPKLGAHRSAVPYVQPQDFCRLLRPPLGDGATVNVAGRRTSQMACPDARRPTPSSLSESCL